MIVGGLLLGTLLTLFVIPSIYTLLVRKVRDPKAEEADLKEPEELKLGHRPLGEQLP